MRTIEIDNEVFGTIEQNASGFGATPNSILRKLLGLDGDAPAEISKPIPSPLIPAELGKTGESGLLRLIRSPRYVSGNGQRKYLAILSQIHAENPKNFGAVTEFQYGGRKHFARSVQEIEKSGRNTSAREIPNTSFAALTNLSTNRKRKILGELLRYFGYSEIVIREVIASWPEAKERKIKSRAA